MGKFDLNSILNERSKEKEMQTTQEIKIDGEIELIDIYDMIPSAENHYSTEQIADLVATIPMTGLLQPVLLNESEEEEGKYDIVAGHRRRTACLFLVEKKGLTQFRHIQAIVKTRKDATLQKLALLVANRFRDKSDWEKMKEAVELKKVFNELLGNRKLDKTTRAQLKELLELQCDEEEMNLRDFIAECLNTSASQIARYEKIYKCLCDTLMTAFEKNEIPISVAYEAAQLSPEYQQQAEDGYKKDGFLTLASVTALKNVELKSKPIQGQIKIDEVKMEAPGKKKITYEEAKKEEIERFELNDQKEYGWMRSGLIKEFFKTEYNSPRNICTVYHLGCPHMVVKKKDVIAFCESNGKVLFEVTRERLEHEYDSTVTEKKEPIPEPRPVHRAETEQSEETQYDEKQTEIANETNYKSEPVQEEQIDESKVLQKSERKALRTDIKITITGREYAEIKYGNQRYLVLADNEYQAGESAVLVERRHEEPTGHEIDIRIVHVSRKRAGIEDKFCIVGFEPRVNGWR